MAKFGAFCFPATGHLNPLTALAYALKRRGHEVVIFGIADVEAKVRAAGLSFCCLGAREYPVGTLKGLDEELAQLKGLAAFRFTLRRVQDSMRMTLRDGPEAVRSAGVDALLVDEAEFAGNVADLLEMPWISVAFTPPLLADDRFPPFWLGWPAGQDRLSRLRNRVGSRALLWFAAPLFREVNEQRTAWGLKPHARPQDALSPWAQITQLPAVLEFPVHGPPVPGLYYPGPFLLAEDGREVEFPWERLDGRPLLYASMGTLQNGSEAVFRTIAEACAGLKAQLVISLGGGMDPETLGRLAGDPVVVRFAPQRRLLRRAALVITHAGLNTVLESLDEGVPMVAIPLANDQPGVAARAKARGACVVVSRHRLTAARLRRAIVTVLEKPEYRRAAQDLQAAMQRLDGPGRAAEVIEDALLRVPGSAAEDGSRKSR